MRNKTVEGLSFKLSMKLKIICNEEVKLINFLKSELQISSRLIRQLKKSQGVTVNDIPISLNARLRKNDVILVQLPKEDNIFEAEEMAIDIVYEDDHLIIINKPPFRVVHPTIGNTSGTIANGIAYMMMKNQENYKIRFANRLDRDTTGLMIICKNGYAQKVISDQMMANTIEKHYMAICSGSFEKDFDTIDAPIGKSEGSEIIRTVRDDGQNCITHYKVLKSDQENTLVDIQLETGRTHQIRVHMKYLGHTIVGDELYGGNHQLINRQALHAYRLVFTNIEGERIDLKIDLPEDMKKVISCDI